MTASEPGRVVRRKPQWALIARAQLRATAAVVQAAFVSDRRTRPAFVVHSRGRTGSTLLVDLIRNHPDVHCDDEIISHRLYVASPDRYIRSRARLFGSKAYGLKIRPGHYATQGMADPAAFIAALHGDRWRFIRLSRRNLLRTALSSALIQETGVVHRTIGGEARRASRVRVSVGDLLKRLERVQHEEQVEADCLATVPHLSLTYEDDILCESDRQETMDRVFSYLGLPPVPVSTKFVRLTTDRFEDFIENYDELGRALAGTRYERFLASDAG